MTEQCRSLSKVAVILLTHDGGNMEFSGNCPYPFWKRCGFSVVHIV